MKNNISMVHEWDCWQIVVLELRKLGVEINDQDDLTKAIKGWGIALTTMALTDKD